MGQSDVDAFFEEEASVRLWIQDVLETELKRDDFPTCLKDGIILCKLMLALKERSIPVIHTDANQFMKLRNNIVFFLQSLEDEYNMARNQLFSVYDLLNGANDVRVIKCLKNLAFAAQKDGYAGPKIRMQLTAEEKTSQINAFGDRPRIIAELLRSSVEVATVVRSATLRPRASDQAIKKARDIRWTELDAVTKRKVTKGVVAFQSLYRTRLCRRTYLKMVRYEAHRTKVASEILSTEINYLENLGVLKVFMETFKAHKDNLGTTQVASLIDIMISYAALLVQDLSPLVNNWGPHSELGECFLKISDYLKVYTSYVKEYGNLIARLQTEKKNSSSFREALAEFEEDPSMQKLPVESYLILPVQRIPRYELLLREMLRYTGEDHSDRERLDRAYKKIQETNAHINAYQKKFENLQKVIEIRNLFSGEVQSFVAPSRQFLKEGVVSGYPKTSHKYTLFLFTDILVVGSGQVGHRRNRKLKLKEVFRLRGVEVSLIKDAPVSQHCFQILKAGAGAEPLIQLAAAEMLERKEWIDAITAQQEELASLLGSDEGATDSESNLIKSAKDALSQDVSWKSKDMPDYIKEALGVPTAPETADTVAPASPRKKTGGGLKRALSERRATISKDDSDKAKSKTKKSNSDRNATKKIKEKKDRTKDKEKQEEAKKEKSGKSKSKEPSKRDKGSRIGKKEKEEIEKVVAPPPMTRSATFMVSSTSRDENAESDRPKLKRRNSMKRFATLKLKGSKKEEENPPKLQFPDISKQIEGSISPRRLTATGDLNPNRTFSDPPDDRRTGFAVSPRPSSSGSLPGDGRPRPKSQPPAMAAGVRMNSLPSVKERSSETSASRQLSSSSSDVTSSRRASPSPSWAQRSDTSDSLDSWLDGSAEDVGMPSPRGMSPRNPVSPRHVAGQHRQSPRGASEDSDRPVPTLNIRSQFCGAPENIRPKSAYDTGGRTSPSPAADMGRPKSVYDSSVRGPAPAVSPRDPRRKLSEAPPVHRETPPSGCPGSSPLKIVPNAVRNGPGSAPMPRRGTEGMKPSGRSFPVPSGRPLPTPNGGAKAPAPDALISGNIAAQRRQRRVLQMSKRRSVSETVVADDDGSASDGTVSPGQTRGTSPSLGRRPNLGTRSLPTPQRKPNSVAAPATSPLHTSSVEESQTDERGAPIVRRQSRGGSQIGYESVKYEE